MVGKHLKIKTVNIPKSAEEFIEGANSIKDAKQAEFKPSADNILLSFSGRIDREKYCEKKGFLIYLKKDAATDIEKYCHGSKQGVINYLIRKGLDELIKDGELKLIFE